MPAFPRRLFLLLVGVLTVIAVALYFYDNTHHNARDIRSAVPVEHFALSNGLTVVVLPNHQLPAVTEMLLVKAGAADDPYGKSGLAHYLEHIMFTGSKNYPEGAYDQAISRVGGSQNAYTTKDYTLFYATVASDQLPMVMAMEADRLQNLNFDPEKVKRELSVITEERNMRVDNSAASQLSEQLTALTFLNHPYHHPTIGWAEDMATFTLEDARAFFNDHYRASNMLVILAGDITESQARRYTEQYYGGLAGGKVAPRNWPQEPPLRLERHATMHDAKVHAPQLLRQYLAPSAVAGDTKQTMPLALLAQVLGGGESSFLYEHLVREDKLASAVDVSYTPFALGPELFTIGATPAPGVTLEQLEQGLDKALAQFAAQPPDAALFARAKTRMKAEVIFAEDGITGLADVMAGLYAIGLDEQYFYDYPTKIDAVTLEQMRAAANVVLTPAKRITGYLLPPDIVPVAAPMEAPHAP